MKTRPPVLTTILVGIAWWRTQASLAAPRLSVETEVGRHRFSLDSLLTFFADFQGIQTDLNQAEDFSPASFFASSGPRNPRNQRSGEKKGRAMNPVIQCKTIILPVLITCVLACFGLLSKAEAIVPAPDGGYPGGNTAEGHLALGSLTSGLYNTGVGIYSLLSITNGSLCTGVGAGTLLSNTGSSNTATGAGALLSNISGTDSTADGAFALFSNTAAGNTAIGSKALLNNTTGGTLETSVLGFDLGPNTAVGSHALESNTDSSSNTAVGYQALSSMVTGPMVDPHLGASTAVGFQALANVNGLDNATNDAFGYQALFGLSNGNSNTAISGQTLFDLTAGLSNVAIGFLAGGGLTSGDGNIYIGVGQFAGAANESGHTYIGNIAFTNVSGVGTDSVTIDLTTGLLGHSTSSRRYKEDIKPMDNASEALYRLKPVTFRYKKDVDRTQSLDYGLIAEEVAEVDPDLAVCNKDGQIESVRYNAINAMLLNEFLKEHKKVEEQQATINDLKSAASKQDATIAKQEKIIADLTKGMEVLTAQLKQQAAQIQKVSARIEVSRVATKLADGRD